MMSTVMVPPMGTIVACGTTMTNDARAVHGEHLAAASSTDKGGIDRGIIVIIGIVIRVTVVINATGRTPAELRPVSEGAAAGKSRGSYND
jgi:hypothetical protein